VIHAITHRIDTKGPTARLLAARAFEYEYLGQWELAIADFDAALALEPRYVAALSGLAQSLLRAGQLERAEVVAGQGLAVETAPEKRAPYHAVIAQVHARSERWEAALAAWRESLSATLPEVDWFLGEAEALARLGRYSERADALGRAKERNPSVVLHRTWIWALVDGGRLEEAMPEIEQSLARAHWKSTWLLLRARVHALRGEHDARRADAQAALDEINVRWGWDHPDRDPYLFAYAGLACALLDDTAKAREHFETARKLGVPSSWLREFEHLLPAAPATAP
jgi:tetratricopeptide (TPR) repeat protein